MSSRFLPNMPVLLVLQEENEENTYYSLILLHLCIVQMLLYGITNVPCKALIQTAH